MGSLKPTYWSQKLKREYKKNPRRALTKWLIRIGKKVSLLGFAKSLIEPIAAHLSKEIFGKDYVTPLLHPIDKATDLVAGQIVGTGAVLFSNKNDIYRQMDYVLQLHTTLSGPASPAACIGSDVMCSLHGMTKIVSGSESCVGIGRVARQGDKTSCGARIIGATGPCMIIDGKIIARVGDMTDHYGVIITGDEHIIC